MLNDVHPPPLEPEFEHGKTPGKNGHRPAATPVAPAAPVTPAVGRNGRHLHDSDDRAHKLEREAGRHTEGVDLVYPEPEDRGDSFNTMMSAVIVGVVLVTVLIVVGMVLHRW